MPWERTDAMKERTKFVLEWERRWKETEGGPINMAELCRMFGVSRQTGYKWVERFRGAGFAVAGVEERSRRPHRSPDALPAELEDLSSDLKGVRLKDSSNVGLIWSIGYRTNSENSYIVSFNHVHYDVYYENGKRTNVSLNPFR